MKDRMVVEAVEAIIAGHICLDIIPALPPGDTALQFHPGVLVETGPVAVATGGCVSNTGQVLHRLGIPTRLVGKIGNDAFGVVVRGVLARSGEDLANGLLMVEGEQTSYSVILNPPGRDRMFLHHPGANDTFVCADIPDDVFARGRIFHFGYPPLMRRMYEDGGHELVCLMTRAKEAGLTTGLDMAYPDPEKASGRADWRSILRSVLPLVDVFVPSLDEVSYMLEGSSTTAQGLNAGPDRAARVAAYASDLGSRLLAHGVGMVGIKTGDLGFYLRTGSADRLRAAGRAIPGDFQAWSEREIWSSVFDASVSSTVGAGDATVAGFIFGLLRSISPEEAVTAACAVGAASVEAADATSGVDSWESVRARVDAGWGRRKLELGAGWRPSTGAGVWLGPHDACGTADSERPWSDRQA